MSVVLCELGLADEAISCPFVRCTEIQTAPHPAKSKLHQTYFIDPALSETDSKGPLY